MYPAIFLDRDGVLIENRADYVRGWSDVQPIPGAIHALALLAGKNYKTVIVTNQSAVGRGIVSLETANEINDWLVDLIHRQGGRVDGVYLCPHKPEDGCHCRKPSPGLLLQAADDLSINLQRSWMVGDAWSDVQAGQRAGVSRTILVKTGRGREQLLQPQPDNTTSPLIFVDLPSAIEAILTIDKTQAFDAQA